MVERKHHLAAIPKISSCEYTVSSGTEGAQFVRCPGGANDQAPVARGEELAGSDALRGPRGQRKIRSAHRPWCKWHKIPWQVYNSNAPHHWHSRSMAGGHGQSKTPSVRHLLCVSAGRAHGHLSIADVGVAGSDAIVWWWATVATGSPGADWSESANPQPQCRGANSMKLGPPYKTAYGPRMPPASATSAWSSTWCDP